MVSCWQLWAPSTSLISTAYTSQKVRWGDLSERPIDIRGEPCQPDYHQRDHSLALPQLFNCLPEPREPRRDTAVEAYPIFAGQAPQRRQVYERDLQVIVFAITSPRLSRRGPLLSHF